MLTQKNAQRDQKRSHIPISRNYIQGSKLKSGKVLN